MRRLYEHLPARPVLLCLCLLLTACAATPPPRLYLLSAGETSPRRDTAAGEQVGTIGLGPVTLPEYLDRQQILIRAGNNRLEASENHRWAEPLADSVPRVLAENLTALLAPIPVVVHPWTRTEAPALHVRVDILRCEAGPDPAQHLVARWMVTGPHGAGTPRLSDIRLDTSLTDHEAQAAAASEALRRLSRDIAAELGKAISP